MTFIISNKLHFMMSEQSGIRVNQQEDFINDIHHTHCSCAWK